MKAWINHFALNLGACLACVFYAILPPRWTGHKAEDIEALDKTNPVKAFWEGLTG